MFIYIRKSTGEIAMRSEGPIEVDEDIFDVVEHAATEEDKEMLEKNTPVQFSDGALVFDEAPAIVEETQNKKEETLLAIITDKKKTIDERLDAVATLLRGDVA